MNTQSFRDVATMEWLKLRSLRSTWFTLAFAVTAAVTVAVLVGAHSKTAGTDVTNNVLAGVAAGLLLTGVLGVLTMTSEYSSGLVRSTLARYRAGGACSPPRPPSSAPSPSPVGEIASFVSYLAGIAALPARIPAPSLTHPAVLRAVLLAGAGYCLIGLIGSASARSSGTPARRSRCSSAVSTSASSSWARSRNGSSRTCRSPSSATRSR